MVLVMAQPSSSILARRPIAARHGADERSVRAAYPVKSALLRLLFSGAFDHLIARADADRPCGMGRWHGFPRQDASTPAAKGVVGLIDGKVDPSGMT
jgi:hypothetical protein